MDPNPSTFAAAAEASARWNKLASIEEKFFCQKSCIRWLGAGDHNTVFFHRAVMTRISRNTIKKLVNDAGEVLTKVSDIKKEAVQHFQRFRQGQQGPEVDSEDMLEDLLTYRCPASSVAGLVAPVTAEEIISALKALPNDKVSCPDGFTKEFYVAAWSVIGG